jgi:sialate O-acetylesterase
MKLSITACLCLVLSYRVNADVRLPRILRDSMVLQRNTTIRIWGWALKAEKVNINFNGKTHHTITGDDGKWMIQLPPMQAGGPYTMEITGRNKIVLKEILIGDVWVCAGQSNMEHQLKLHPLNYAAEITTANFPLIRQFKIPYTTNLVTPGQDLSGGAWTWANPNDIGDFSAVAFFYAKALFEKYHVPIGIINASWGGIPIEAMMSEESLKDFPAIAGIVRKNKDTAYVYGFNRKVLAIQQSLKPPSDKGLTEKWYDTTYLPEGWHTIAIPGYWADQGAKDLNGIVWYRREIDLPASLATVASTVFLGRIVDADELYINGNKVGGTGYMYPQRRYKVPAGLLKPGKNLFLIRVTCNSGKGGFVPEKPYRLFSGKDSIDLTGYWQYKAGFVKNPQDAGTAATEIALQNQPTALYNSMIAPITGYAIRGFVWYQGESNTGNPDVYAKLQPAMISDWRNKWLQGELPFLFVQLPGFGDYHYLPSESQWARFREAQAKSLSIPNTAMAVGIDIGEWNDVHPDKKKEVGDRLALAAEEMVYRDKINGSGPHYQSSVIQGNQIVVSFHNIGSGLTTSDGQMPAEFSIASADKNFVWAKTKIVNNQVIVWSDEVKDPRYVRYAWSDQPVNPNLYNKDKLPAAPFRTDE